MTDKQIIESALRLSSDILDIHTENTETDKAYRNVARLFIRVLSQMPDDEDTKLEE